MLATPERYISLWKQFICYIFRVLQRKPQQRREIYNLRFQSGEVKMMQYISTLVHQIQQEDEGEYCLDELDELVEVDYRD